MILAILVCFNLFAFVYAKDVGSSPQFKKNMTFASANKRRLETILITVGSSTNLSKTITPSVPNGQVLQCPETITKSERKNPDYDDVDDAFGVSVSSSNQMTVTRTDARQSWSMNLQFECTITDGSSSGGKYAVTQPVVTVPTFQTIQRNVARDGVKVCVNQTTMSNSLNDASTSYLELLPLSNNPNTTKIGVTTKITTPIVTAYGHHTRRGFYTEYTSHNTASSLCTSLGSSLCSREDLCPGFNPATMKTKVNYLPRFQDIPGKPGVNNLGGVWVPVSDQVHGSQLLEWVHLGSSKSDSGVCKLYSEQNQMVNNRISSCGSSPAGYGGKGGMAYNSGDERGCKNSATVCCDTKNASTSVCANANTICAHGISPSSTEICCNSNSTSASSASSSSFCGLIDYEHFESSSHQNQNQWRNIDLALPGCRLIDYLRVQDGYQIEIATGRDGTGSVTGFQTDGTSVDLFAIGGGTRLVIQSLRITRALVPLTPWYRRKRIANTFLFELKSVAANSIENDWLKSVSFGMKYNCNLNTADQTINVQFDCLTKYFSIKDVNALNERDGCGWIDISTWNRIVKPSGSVNVVPKWLYTDKNGWILSSSQNVLSGTKNDIFASSYGDPLIDNVDVNNNVDYIDGVQMREEDNIRGVWSYKAEFVNC